MGRQTDRQTDRQTAVTPAYCSAETASSFRLYIPLPCSVMHHTHAHTRTHKDSSALKEIPGDKGGQPFRNILHPSFLLAFPPSLPSSLPTSLLSPSLPPSSTALHSFHLCSLTGSPVVCKGNTHTHTNTEPAVELMDSLSTPGRAVACSQLEGWRGHGATRPALPQ